METPVNIQSLIDTKNKIQKSIENIDSKIKLVESKASIIAPKDTEKITKQVQIKKLELSKIKVGLNQSFKEVDLKIKYVMGVISEEEYNANAAFLSEQLNQELAQINENIFQLQQTQNEFSELERIQKVNKKLAQLNLQNAKKEIVLATKRQITSIAKFGGKEAIIGIISVLINLGLSRLSKEVGNLEVLVDNVNNVIANIQTKQDIEKATKLRNNALRLLNSAESRLKKLEKIVKTINRVLRILNIALRILKIVALLPGAPKALLVILIEAIDIVSSLLIILTATQNTLNKLILKVQELKRRLKEIGNIIDNQLNNPELDLNKLDIFNITSSNYGKLGLLDEIYKGFKFAIKEENNAKFVVQGNKRRFAVAINNDGNEVLIGEPSFTLDPDVLIEQLKLIIDEQNLTP